LAKFVEYPKRGWRRWFLEFLYLGSFRQSVRLTAEGIKNLIALSGIAYEYLEAIIPFLLAPTPAPNRFIKVSAITKRQNTGGLVD
jgi:hypothetical protein